MDNQITDADIAAQQPAPLTPFKLAVYFTAAKGEFRDNRRIFLNGVVDLRTQDQIEGAERLIREQLGFDAVLITSWKKLEG